MRGMTATLIVIAAAVAGVALFFAIPYSKTRTEFDRITAKAISRIPDTSDRFDTADFSGLPLPVRHYFEQAGFVGRTKMSGMKLDFQDVNFVLSKGKKPVSIRYLQYNSAVEPLRFAFIGARLFGIPFQGLDVYQEGRGSMKGVLAKTFTLFNQRGAEMDQACLVTYLAESLLLPSAAVQPFIRWEAMDRYHARAVIAYRGAEAQGLFTFNDDGDPTRFLTEDRYIVSEDGTAVRVPWSALYRDYRVVDGIRRPARVQAVWHYPEGDQVYFDSRRLELEYVLT